MKNNPKEFAEEFAERMIELMRENKAPWQKTWDSSKASRTSTLPRNPTTGKRYRGGNSFWLQAQGYDDPRWMTYKQVQKVGAQVRQGEKSTTIEHWRFHEERVKRDESGKIVRDKEGKSIKVRVELQRPQVSYPKVFNAEQIDGLPPLKIEPPKPLDERLKRVSSIIEESKAEIEHSQTAQPSYNYRKDKINMPHQEQFESDSEYFSVLLHEVGHWTGHESRLNRDIAHPYGSEDYAKEELRAEIFSFMASCEYDIDHNAENHASYVNGWIKVLEDDPREVFRAARDAENILSFVSKFDLDREVEIKPEIEKVERVNETGTRFRTKDELVSYAMKKQDDARQGAYVENYYQVPYEKRAEARAADGKWDSEAEAWLIPEMKVEAGKLGYPLKDVKDMAREKVLLNVPFAEKNEAKKLGAKWDKQQSTWFVMNDGSQKQEDFAKWLGQEPQIQKEAARSFASVTDHQLAMTKFLEENGLVFEKPPIFDGQRRRAKADGDKKGEMSASYRGFLDGAPNVLFNNFKTGVQDKLVITPKNNRESRDFQKANEALKQKTEEAKQKRFADYEKVAEKSAAVCSKLEAITEQNKTPYMHRKGIQAHAGVLLSRTSMVVPYHDKNGKQWTSQYINEDGSKRFVAGGRKKGMFHAVGGIESVKDADTIIIAEGYATGASIKEAMAGDNPRKTGVVVAGDVYNMKDVALSAKELNPKADIVIAADYDASKLLSAGSAKEALDKGLWPPQAKPQTLAKAEDAAKAVDGTVIKPVLTAKEAIDDKMSDFNDIAQAKGWEEVRASIHKQIDASRTAKQAIKQEVEQAKEQKIEQRKVKSRGR